MQESQAQIYLTVLRDGKTETEARREANLTFRQVYEARYQDPRFVYEEALAKHEGSSENRDKVERALLAGAVKRDVKAIELWLSRQEIPDPPQEPVRSPETGDPSSGDRKGALPWTRRKNETKTAWEAFRTYRDMGPARSIAKVGRELGKSDALLERWSSKWQWVKRAREFDEETDRLLLEARAQAIQEMGRRQVELAVLMQSKIWERLQAIDPADLKLDQLPRWLEVAAKVERVALGQPAETHSITGRDGGPIETVERADPKPDALVGVANVLMDVGVLQIEDKRKGAA